jgi:hypothetical protein
LGQAFGVVSSFFLTEFLPPFLASRNTFDAISQKTGLRNSRQDTGVIHEQDHRLGINRFAGMKNSGILRIIPQFPNHPLSLGVVLC